MIEAVGVPFVSRLAVASVLIVVDDVRLRVLGLFLMALLHYGNLLAELSADVLSWILSFLPSSILTTCHLFFDRLAVLLVLLGDGGAV